MGVIDRLKSWMSVAEIETETELTMQQTMLCYIVGNVGDEYAKTKVMGGERYVNSTERIRVIAFLVDHEVVEEDLWNWGEVPTVKRYGVTVAESDGFEYDVDWLVRNDALEKIMEGRNRAFYRRTDRVPDHLDDAVEQYFDIEWSDVEDVLEKHHRRNLVSMIIDLHDEYPEYDPRKTIS